MPPPCRGSRRRMVNKAIIAFHVFMSDSYVAGRRCGMARVQAQPIDLMRLQSWETAVRLRRPEVGFRPRKASGNIALRDRPATTEALAPGRWSGGGAAGRRVTHWRRSRRIPFVSPRDARLRLATDRVRRFCPRRFAAAPEPTPARSAGRRQNAATADDGEIDPPRSHRRTRRSHRRRQTRKIESRKNRQSAAIIIRCAFMPSTKFLAADGGRTRHRRA
jgi:hypothetical protein